MALLLFPGDLSGAITKIKDVVTYLCLDYLKASRKSRIESSSSTCKQVTLEATLCRTQPLALNSMWVHYITDIYRYIAIRI